MKGFVQSQCFGDERDQDPLDYRSGPPCTALNPTSWPAHPGTPSPESSPLSWAGQGSLLPPPPIQALLAVAGPSPSPPLPFPDGNCFHVARPGSYAFGKEAACKVSSGNQGDPGVRGGALWGLSTGTCCGGHSRCLVSPDSCQVGTPLRLATLLRAGVAPPRPASQSSGELPFCP